MLTLTDKDLNELQTLINDFRHKEATALIQFIVGKQNAAGAAPAKASDEPVEINPTQGKRPRRHDAEHAEARA